MPSFLVSDRAIASSTLLPPAYSSGDRESVQDRIAAALHRPVGGPTMGRVDETPANGEALTTEDGIELIASPTSLAHLTHVAERTFGDLGLVKAAVDVERRVMAIGGGLHVDEQAVLLNDGSRQRDVWGINLYPAQYGSPDWLEFDSTINLRPPGNRSRSVQDPATQALVIDVVRALVRR